MLNDLLLNLVAEGIGIIVTVFIIDRLIKLREKKRWLPTQQFVYSLLLELVGKFFISSIPVKYSNTIYLFGVFRSVPGMDITDDSFFEKIRDFESDSHFYGTDNFFNRIAEIKGKLGEVLTLSDDLLEPDIQTNLFEFNDHLSQLNQADITRETLLGKEYFWQVFRSSLNKAHQIGTWLIYKSDGGVPPVELQSEVKGIECIPEKQIVDQIAIPMNGKLVKKFGFDYLINEYCEIPLYLKGHPWEHKQQCAPGPVELCRCEKTFCGRHGQFGKCMICIYEELTEKD